MKPVSTCRECPFAKMVNVGDGTVLPDLVAMACTVAPQTAPPTLMSLVGKTGLAARPAWCPLPIVVHAAESTLADDGPHTLPLPPNTKPDLAPLSWWRRAAEEALEDVKRRTPAEAAAAVHAAIGPRTPRQLVALRAEAVHERQLAKRVATRSPCDECQRASHCPYAFAPRTFDGACVAPGPAR